MSDQDQELLRELGRFAREEGELAHLDERWDRLAAGTLSAEEDAELRRLAATSDEARLAYEAFRPLGREFEAGVVAAIATLQTAKPPDNVIPFWRRVARRVAAGTAAASTVAAALVIVVPRLMSPLPVYNVAELSGGARTMRGDLAETQQLAPGDRLVATLQPDTAVGGAAWLRAEACVVRNEEARQLEVAAEPGTAGVLRLSATLDPDLPPGDWTLWLVVGRLGTLPSVADLRSLSPDLPVQKRHWVALPRTLHVRPRAPA